MTARYFAKDALNHGVGGVPSGYVGTSTGEFDVPSCGIEDVDRSMLRLFDAEIKLQAHCSDGPKKVPIVFAAGEKWAQIKKGNGLRDASGTLILPLIVIARADFQQSLSADIAGRGINQATGELKFRRKLSQLDRGAQALLNRELIRNQANAAVASVDSTLSDQLITGRDVGLLSDDPTVRDGGLLISDLRSSVTEIVTLPTPQFMTVKYELTLWAQHQQQMNQIVEGVVSSYLPQTRGWRLDTEKGYWFVGRVTSDDFRNEGNVGDQTGQERLIKHTMQVEVPAFIVASSAPGAPIAVRSHLSNPVVSFEFNVGSSSEAFDSSIVEEPFLGADDPTLPRTAASRRRDLRDTGHGRVFPSSMDVNPNDPALEGLRRGQKPSKWRRVSVQLPSGRVEKRFIRIRSYNGRSGEITFDAAQLEGGTIVSVDG